MMMKTAYLVFLSLCLPVMHFPIMAVELDSGQIMLRDGRMLTGTISWQNGSWRCNNIACPSSKIIRVSWGTPSPSPAPNPVEHISLDDGTILVGQTTSWNVKGLIRVKLWEGPLLEIPLSRIRRIQCASLPAQLAPKLSEQKSSIRVVMKDGLVQEGKLAYLTAYFIGIRTSSGRTDEISKGSIHRIDLLGSGTVSSKQAILVTTEWGARIMARDLAVDGVHRQFKMQTVFGDYSLPWSAVVSLDYGLDRRIALSGLAAQHTELKPFVAQIMPPHKGSGMLWQDVSLGNMLLENLISFQPRTVAVYRVPANTTAFSGVFFIDTRGVSAGDASVRIMSPRGKLWEARLSSSGLPQWCYLNLKKVDEIAIEIDFGSKGNAGTYVVLGDPWFYQK